MDGHQASATIDEAVGGVRTWREAPTLTHIRAIQSMLVPHYSRDEALYFNHSYDARQIASGAVELEPYGRLSLNSFANSFYESYWSAYTNVERIGVAMAGAGTASCHVYRQEGGCSPRVVAKPLVNLDEGPVEISVPRRRKPARKAAGYTLS